MTDYIPTINYVQVVPNSNVPNTNWVREVYVSGIYAQFGEHHQLAKDAFGDFNRWLEQHNQAKELEVREKVAREIEDARWGDECALDPNCECHIRIPIFNECIEIAKGNQDV